MNSPTLSLSFSVARHDTLGTLETVLSIARRGGLQLAGMTLHESRPFDVATMTLRADDSDRLDLFVRRLGNVIDVSNIHCLLPMSTLLTVNED